MKRCLLLLSLLFPLGLYAQVSEIYERKGIAVDPEALRAKLFPVPDKDGNACALVTILSAVGPLHLEGNIVQYETIPGKTMVYMPEGSQKLVISVDGCKPYICEFLPLNSGYCYVIEIDVKEINPIRTLIMPSFSYNKSQYSYGMMLGICKNNGFYLRAKTDFHFDQLNPSLQCDAEGKVNGTSAWFTGETQTSRLAFTGGYLRRLFKDKLYFYLGGGYGIRTLAWEMIIDNDRRGNEYVKVEPSSFRGYEIETGLLLRLGGFSLSAGVQTNVDRFRYYEANMGIGVML